MPASFSKEAFLFEELELQVLILVMDYKQQVASNVIASHLIIRFNRGRSMASNKGWEHISGADNVLQNAES